MGVLSVYFIIPSDMNSSYYNAFLKSITFYAVPLVNKSQTTINGKQMLVFKSNDILIEKLDPVDIIYYTSIGYRLDAIKIQWDDTVITWESGPTPLSRPFGEQVCWIDPYRDRQASRIIRVSFGVQLFNRNDPD
jgi:hypothetical protein